MTIWHGRSQLKNVDSSGIWTRPFGIPVRRSTCWATESTGIRGEFQILQRQIIMKKKILFMSFWGWFSHVFQLLEEFEMKREETRFVWTMDWMKQREEPVHFNNLWPSWITQFALIFLVLHFKKINRACLRGWLAKRIDDQYATPTRFPSQQCDASFGPFRNFQHIDSTKFGAANTHHTDLPWYTILQHKPATKMDECTRTLRK